MRQGLHNASYIMLATAMQEVHKGSSKMSTGAFSPCL
jgi:hypothetical protein